MILWVQLDWTRARIMSPVQCLFNICLFRRQKIHREVDWRALMLSFVMYKRMSRLTWTLISRNVSLFFCTLENDEWSSILKPYIKNFKKSLAPLFPFSRLCFIIVANVKRKCNCAPSTSAQSTQNRLNLRVKYVPTRANAAMKSKIFVCPYNTLYYSRVR